MNELGNLREKIDKIDRQLLSLFLERMEICGKVADYKRENDIPVLDAEREKQLLEEKRSMLDSPDMSDEVYEFFNSIMTISRIRQSKLLATDGREVCDGVIKRATKRKNDPTVACFGYEGSFSEEATDKIFGEGCQKIYSYSFVEAFDALQSGKADYAVLPIENSSTGVISQVLDLLAKREYYIVGEEYIPIRHCLIAGKGTRKEDIKKLYSHEQAFLQCDEFISTLGEIEKIPYYSTALSAKAVAEMKDKTAAAIASERTAYIYNLEIIEKDLNSIDCNTTRFVVISKTPEIADDADKISAVFTLDHKSGELYRILSTFARGGLNLLKLESRPIPEQPFECKFFADYSGNLKAENVKMLTENIMSESREFRLLGNYKNVDGAHR